MKRGSGGTVTGVLLAACALAMLVGGCTCKEQADEAADEMTGGGVIRRGEETMKEVRNINAAQKRALEDATRAAGRQGGR